MRKKKEVTTPVNTCHPERKHYAKGLCYLCYMDAFRKARPQYREYTRKYCQKYRIDNKERLREFDKIRKSRPEFKQLSAQYARRSRLRKYGLLEKHVEELFEAQNNSCAICKCHITRKNVNIDHDHKTREVRGLLCQPCNRGLGLLKDSLELLTNAREYLLKPPVTKTVLKRQAPIAIC